MPSPSTLALALCTLVLVATVFGSASPHVKARSVRALAMDLSDSPALPTTPAPAPSHALTQDNWNVECTNGGRCSEAYPICCGQASFLFCVSGGDKCCQSFTNPSMYASCAPFETCCAGTNDIDCCNNNNQTCGIGNICIYDECRVNTDPDMCVSDELCVWNCDDQACEQKNITAATKFLYRKNQRCGDPCRYASTCDRCGQAKDAQGKGCSWCCQSQSCSSSADENFSCGQLEVINDRFGEQCPTCGFGGHGLHKMNTKTLQLELMVVTAVAISLALCLTCVLRVAILRRQRMEFLAEEALNSVEGVRNSHSRVKKYGFKAKKKKGEEEDEKEKEEDAELSEDEQRQIDDANPFLKVTRNSKVPGQRVDETTDGSDTEREGDEASEAPVVPDAVLLPCGCHYTAPAASVNVKPEEKKKDEADKDKESSSANRRDSEIELSDDPAGTETAAPPGAAAASPTDSQPAIEKPDKCPTCGAEVQEIFIPRRVIR